MLKKAKKSRNAPTLWFNSPDDPVTGYLSNASSFGFEMEGVLWPSVEHFLLAKQFQDTPLEENIRRASSVWNARCMCRPKIRVVNEDGWVYKRKEYPAKRDEEWEKKIPTLLEQALLAKFSSTRLTSKLMATGETILVDTSDTPFAPFTGSILERIRARAKISKTPAAAAALEFPEDDLFSGTFTEEERELFEKLLRLLIRIRMEEGQKKLYVEMVRDVIFNIIPESTTDEKTLQTELTEMVMRIPTWSHMFTSTPNFRTILDRIKTDYYLDSDVAHALLRLFRWFVLTSDDSLLKKQAMKKLQHIDDIEIMFMPERRHYRGPPPPCPLVIPCNNIVVSRGDLLGFTHPEYDELVWIGVLGCCTATRLRIPGGVTDAVYETFPYSNLYAINSASKGGRGFELGSAVISKPLIHSTNEEAPSKLLCRNVVTFFCEASQNDTNYDTKDNRRKWFDTALRQFAKIMKGRFVVLAMSKNQVEPYRDVITKFSSQYPDGIEFQLIEGPVISRKGLPHIDITPRFDANVSGRSSVVIPVEAKKEPKAKISRTTSEDSIEHTDSSEEVIVMKKTDTHSEPTKTVASLNDKIEEIIHDVNTTKAGTAKKIDKKEELNVARVVAPLNIRKDKAEHLISSKKRQVSSEKRAEHKRNETVLPGALTGGPSQWLSTAQSLPFSERRKFVLDTDKELDTEAKNVLEEIDNLSDVHSEGLRPEGEHGETLRPEGEHGETLRPEGEHGETLRPEGEHGETLRPEGEHGETLRPEGEHGETLRPEGENETPLPKEEKETDSDVNEQDSDDEE